MTALAFKALAVLAVLSPLGLALLDSRKTERALRRIVGGAFAAACGASLLLLLVQLAIVLLRSVFSVSFVWLSESTLYLFGSIFLLASGALILSEGHVRVDILYTKLARRRQQLIDLLGLGLLVIPLGLLIIWVSWRYVGTSWAQLERSPEAGGIHAVFLLKSLIPAFAVLIIFAAEARMIALWRSLRGESA